VMKTSAMPVSVLRITTFEPPQVAQANQSTPRKRAPTAPASASAALTVASLIESSPSFVVIARPPILGRIGTWRRAAVSAENRARPILSRPVSRLARASESESLDYSSNLHHDRAASRHDGQIPIQGSQSTMQ